MAGKDERMTDRQRAYIYYLGERKRGAGPLFENGLPRTMTSAQAERMIAKLEALPDVTPLPIEVELPPEVAN